MSDSTESTGLEREFDVTVCAKSVVADGVVAIDITRTDGDDFPSWESGSHIDVLLENGLVRQYSLCGELSNRRVWTIAVLREPKSRGGSAYIHDHLTVGARIVIRGPRNNFRLEDSAGYIFIAGGIGITPILPMIEEAQLRGAAWSLVYGGRTRESMAFLSHLAGYEASVVVVPESELGRPDLAGLLGAPQRETLIYSCGPEPLLDAVARECAHWGGGVLHVERFKPRAEVFTPTEGFVIQLDKSGKTLSVPEDRSILEVVSDAGIDVLSSCESGVCGTCIVSVVSGTPDHRDSVLSIAERDAGRCMAICVSRSLTPRLVLEL
jgi:ferredoxin-NADP reductase